MIPACIRSSHTPLQRHLWLDASLLTLPDNLVCRGQVLSQIMYAMYGSDRAVVQRCACALAHMASIPDLHAAFVERKGLDILVDMLTDSKRDTRDAVQREAASALFHARTSILKARPVACCTWSTLTEHTTLIRTYCKNAAQGLVNLVGLAVSLAVSFGGLTEPLCVLHFAGALNQLAEKIQARKPIPPEQLPASSKVRDSK